MRNKDRFPAKGFIPFERDRNDRTRFFQIAVVVVVVVVFNDMRVTNTFFIWFSFGKFRDGLMQNF